RGASPWSGADGYVSGWSLVVLSGFVCGTGGPPRAQIGGLGVGGARPHLPVSGPVWDVERARAAFRVPALVVVGAHLVDAGAARARARRGERDARGDLADARERVLAGRDLRGLAVLQGRGRRGRHGGDAVLGRVEQGLRGAHAAALRRPRIRPACASAHGTQ